jgi:hypothetical protein
MNHRITALIASAAALTFSAGAAFADDQAPAAAAPAAPAAAPAPPSLMPPMTAPLTANPNPMSVDLGPLGNKVYITGALTGMGLTQNNHVPGDQSTLGDLTSAQIFINKADGVFQYFVDVGTYSLPALGTLPYVKASTTTALTYDVLPMAFIKIQPTASFSIQAGKLPTLIGDEYAYTFENSNIERGLLWGVEPLVSRGVQANYTTGPFTFNVAWTDGFYSNDYSTISGAATWVISPTDTVIFQGQDQTRKSNRTTFTTLPIYNNSSLIDLIWTHTMGPWSFTPYFQYTTSPTDPKNGVTKATDTWGVALLSTYTFDAKSQLAGVSLPFRFEYISQSDGKGVGSPLWGPGSNGWSFTLTPTYTFGRYFVRGEVSYVGLSHYLYGYGSTGSTGSQTRGLLELGVLF